MCYFNIRQYLTTLYKSEFFPKTLFLSKYLFNKIYIQQNLNDNSFHALLRLIYIKI